MKDERADWAAGRVTPPEHAIGAPDDEINDLTPQEDEQDQIQGGRKDGGAPGQGADTMSASYTWNT